MSAAVPRLRVGLLGYGLAGKVFHAPLIEASRSPVLAAVVTQDRERRAALRTTHPDAAVVDTPEQLWDRAAELDLVVVATPNRSHAPLARAALRAGLAVVIDKPMATSAAEARGRRQYQSRSTSGTGRGSVRRARVRDGRLVVCGHLRAPCSVGRPGHA